MNAAVTNRENFEWLGNQIRAKTACYEVSIRATGERPPNWEEKAGAFAKMEDDLQKDLALLLAFGDYADNTVQFKNVQAFLFKAIYAVASQEKTRKPGLDKLCEQIARMELYFYFHPHLEAKFTGEGRLWFAGVEIAYKTYQNNWKHFGDAAKMMLEEAEIAASDIITKYRKDLRKQ